MANLPQRKPEPTCDVRRWYDAAVQVLADMLVEDRTDHPTRAEWPEGEWPWSSWNSGFAARMKARKPRARKAKQDA